MITSPHVNLKTVQKQPPKSLLLETEARRELRRRGKRMLKLEPARKQNNSTKIAKKQ